MKPGAAKFLRFAASSAVAALVVAVLMVSVLWGFGLLERPEEGIEAQRIDILSTSSRLDVAELVEGPGRRTLPELPPLAEIPPLEIPERTTTGFVQVEFEVGEDGTVQSAEVVNALPAGIYEEEALRRVKSRRWAPDPRGEKLTEVVRFSVPEEPKD